MAKATRARTTSPKNPKPATSAVPEKTNGHATPELENTIRARAYELYLQRGRRDGFDQDDWFKAETEVLGQNHRRTA
jgi:Protein of unknown function (DUF2934)